MTFSLESWNIELILLLLIIITSTGWAILTQGAPHTTGIISQALHPDKLLCSLLWTTLFCCATSPTQASEAPKVVLLSWSLEYTEGKLIQMIQPLCNKRSFLPSRQSFRDWKRTTQHAFLQPNPLSQWGCKYELTLCTEMPQQNLSSALISLEVTLTLAHSRAP